MKKQIKRTAAALALLCSLLLPLLLPNAALAEEPGGKTDRFNVVLVVDKSGSLRDGNGVGTDPDGLRFDALRLFLGLLTEYGNEVGAVVFDERIRYEAAPQPLEGMEAKKELIRKLEAYSPGYDTDIGSAVLRATEMLRGMEEENGLPCVIMLFSDGQTDFSTGNDIQAQMQRSWAVADRALTEAREAGITINGILLNVDDKAERGRVEFQLYTYGTNGAFEEVARPEDLTTAFRRFYAIINNTEYTGVQRVAFSREGTAEIFFTVPSFGVEEVNVIVEGENIDEEDRFDERVGMEILRPDGERFDLAGHELSSARYRLVKIPEPKLGVWNVRLKGKPRDWVDVTMVCNASLSVSLYGGDDAYRTGLPYPFTAKVKDPAMPHLTQEQLGEMDGTLAVEELSTGIVREHVMRFENGSFLCRIGFPRSGEYSLRAAVGLGDFKVLSDPLEISVEAAPLVPKVDRITDMLAYGRFRDGCWELELDELFGVGEGSGLSYALSDDCGGVLSVEDGVLRARLRDAEPLSFTLTATDLMDQSAEIEFELTVPAVEAKLDKIDDVFKQGTLRDSRWELGLDGLFEDPKGWELSYALSDDLGGAATIEDGTLKLRFRDTEPLSFTLTATDSLNQSAEIPVHLRAPAITTTVKSVTDMLKNGRLEGGVWETELDKLFLDPKGYALKYALSDDCGGAVTIEDGVLRMDLSRAKEAAFSVTASNVLGLEAELPFDLRLPGPAATVDEITETVKTGLFQEGKGNWERRLDVLFRDPKGTKLTYTLSDDLGGAAKIDGRTLRVDMTGQKKAAFSAVATDAYGLSAEIPITLTEKNMTRIYALWAAAGLLGVGGVIGLIVWLRRRDEE